MGLCLIILSYVRLLNKIRHVQESCRLLQTLKLLTAIGIFNLNEEVLVAISIELIEDILEVHCTRSTQYHEILDVQHLDTISTTSQPSHRILLSHNGPVAVKLEDYISRIGIIHIEIFDDLCVAHAHAREQVAKYSSLTVGSLQSPLRRQYY